MQRAKSVREPKQPILARQGDHSLPEWSHNRGTLSRTPYCWKRTRRISEGLKGGKPIVKHKLESRLPGEISTTSDMQLSPLLQQKEKRNWRASGWKCKSVRKHLTRGFLCAVSDLSGILWSLLIPEYSGIKRRGTPFPGLRNPGISLVSFSFWW